jgi:hypothetical protein
MNFIYIKNQSSEENIYIYIYIYRERERERANNTEYLLRNEGLWVDHAHPLTPPLMKR